MKLRTLFLSALLFSNVTLAHTASDIEINHSYARATPPTAVNSAIFAHIVNNSNEDRYLVSATSNVSDNVELHDVIKYNDVMKMRQVEKIRIPAKSDVMLKPGSFHIMLLDINQALVEGKDVTMTLNFANGESISQSVPIKKVMHSMKH